MWDLLTSNHAAEAEEQHVSSSVGIPLPSFATGQAHSENGDFTVTSMSGSPHLKPSLIVVKNIVFEWNFSTILTLQDHVCLIRHSPSFRYIDLVAFPIGHRNIFFMVNRIFPLTMMTIESVSRNGRSVMVSWKMHHVL